jgi:hypothetical protein
VKSVGTELIIVFVQVKTQLIGNLEAAKLVEVVQIIVFALIEVLIHLVGQMEHVKNVPTELNTVFVILEEILKDGKMELARDVIMDVIIAFAR